MKKRFFVISVLIFAMIIPMLIGCGSEPAAETSGEKSGLPDASQKEPEKSEEEKGGLLDVFQKEPGALRILIDLEHAEMLARENMNMMIAEFENGLKQSCGLSDYEIEYLPMEGVERETALNRIRAELMAGEGPDVFIVKCHSDTSFSDPLFTIPEEAMMNDFFLPLDEYIENNTQFTEWDKLTKAVMDAGRDEEGQQLVPLAYTMPILYLGESESSITVPENMTWSEMQVDEELSFESKMLSDLSVFTSETEVSSVGITNILDFILGTPADYETEKLAFTEEELQQSVDEMLRLSQEARSGAYTDVPVHSESVLSVSLKNIRREIGEGSGKPWEMVSVCSKDGGYTALITSFAAINRNTERAEDAFAVLDLLMRKETQDNYRMYSELLLWGSFPMHEESMKNEPMGIFDDVMSEAEFAELCEVRGNITSAHFQGVLSLELQMMLYECEMAVESGQSTETIVAEYYQQIERMLAE